MNSLLRREDPPELSHRPHRNRSRRRRYRNRRNHGPVTLTNHSQIAETYTNSAVLTPACDSPNPMTAAETMEMIAVETMEIITTEIIIDLLRVTSPSMLTVPLASTRIGLQSENSRAQELTTMNGTRRIEDVVDLLLLAMPSAVTKSVGKSGMSDKNAGRAVIGTQRIEGESREKRLCLRPGSFWSRTTTINRN